jgi:SNF2 family DNA or RNA helicase
MKRGLTCKNHILIIDEAHNLGRLGERSKVINKCAQAAFKVLLLSATPVQNNPYEILNLLTMITSTFDLKKYKKSAMQTLVASEFETKPSASFKHLFDCNVSVFINKDTKNYPNSTEHVVNLTMSPAYYYEYYNVERDIKQDLPKIFTDTKNLITFLNGARRAVNMINQISPKINWALEKILDEISHGRKCLLYSAWRQTGIDIISLALKEKGIPFSQVSGSMSRDQRTKHINDYNHNKTKVMIVTVAGAEGLDLKATRNVIIVEPHWNQARTKQIIGRAVRYGSHAKISEKSRNVNIYYLNLVKPEKKYLIRDDKLPTADEILTRIGETKSLSINTFYDKLKEVSIENNKKFFS